MKGISFLCEEVDDACDELVINRVIGNAYGLSLFLHERGHMFFVCENVIHGNYPKIYNIA